MSDLLTALHRMVPASSTVIKTRFYLTPDNVLRSLELAGIEFKVQQISPNWDAECKTLDDLEILERISINEAGHQGQLLIYSDTCDELTCKAEDLMQFIQNYPIGMFFDGDTILLSEESRTITIVHHEGIYVHARL